LGGFDEVRAAAGTTASGPGPAPRWDSILSEHTALARAACGKASVISTMKPSGRYQNSPLDVCESPDSRYYADFFLFLPSHLFSLFPFSLYCFSPSLQFDIPICIFSIFCPSHRIASHLSCFLYFAMARTKQATPLRRDPSSEYFSRDLTGTPSRSPAAWENEKSNGEANGHANGSVAEKPATARKEAGAMQLLVAVGGIYASLYARFHFYGYLIVSSADMLLTVLPGPSSKSA
jgi:hypothetical protein